MELRKPKKIECNLDQIMVRLGIKNVDLAEMTGLYASQISRIRYGADLKISTAQVIARALGMRIDYIWPYRWQ